MSLEARLAIEEFETLAKGIILRGYYRPGGESGASLRKLMVLSKPALYPLAGDPDRVDAGALKYVLMRLPDGIWSVRQITVAREIESEVARDFDPVETRARRRPTFRTGAESYVTSFRGGMSDLLDFVSALTCYQIESDKIRARYSAYRSKLAEDPALYSVWRALDAVSDGAAPPGEEDRKRLLHELSVELRCDYGALKSLDQSLDGRLPEVIGCISRAHPRDLKVVFSDRFGLVGTYSRRAREWTASLVEAIGQLGLSGAPLHLVSSNTHSLVNVLSPWVGRRAAEAGMGGSPDYGALRRLLPGWSCEERMAEDRIAGIHHMSVAPGMPACQIVDMSRIDGSMADPRLGWNGRREGVIVNMDYAFGEEGFFIFNEIMEALGGLIRSVFIVGKAGTLAGSRGDIMLPSFFVKQGSGEVYDIGNCLRPEDFAGLGDFEVITGGPMLTVAGTFLQNAEVLEYFRARWKALGVEMEGIPYAKAVRQAVLRGRLAEGVQTGIAYYASDAPLSGDLLSEPMGERGVEPVYAVTLAVVRRMLAVRPG
ncbi:hypothetical protein GX411_04680 [Candidatus Fermentibacteria bacterium]|nr:hypothetical protein [Candidatus Fermentibacteria bacterium]